MPRTRRTVANDIAERFLPSKRATVEGAATTAECLAAMLRGRLDARLQPGEASEIIDHMHRSLSLQVEAQECQQRAHALLAVYRDRFAIPPSAYGVEDTPTKTSIDSSEAAALKLVG